MQTYPGLQVTGAFTIAPSDTATVETYADNTRKYKHCAIYTSTAGNIKVTMPDGSTPTFVGLPAGAFLPIQATMVWATGTTCTGMLGLISQ